MIKKYDYFIKQNILDIDGSAIVFDFPIASTIELLGMLIIRLEHLPNKIYNRNVFGVSLEEKNIKWQISDKKKGFPFEKNCFFTSIVIDDSKLRLNNWCDYYIIVDPLNGEILEEGITK